ncbi:MAG TPA: Fic family protein [Solirubrobacterales bacterium]|nr:Fic family protein [Solirubrobacterales bacterium]
MDDAAVAAVTAATRALAHLDASRPGVASLSAIAGSLLRSESAASSRIEGLAISQRRLARAAYRGAASRDNTAAEILGNVDAMERAIELGATGSRFEAADLCEIYRSLLRHTADRKIAGAVRKVQNWIGGNDFNPIGAAYVPPPPEAVPALLEDLCRFVSREDLAPVAQAAIAHAQFENIHPFVDGNGRVGRALVHSILRRREETLNYVPPISLVLEAAPKSYVAGFGAYSRGDVSGWCATFAWAAERAAREAERLATAIESLQEEWLARLGRPRSDAAARQLVSALPERPVIDVAAGRQLTGKSHVAVQAALKQLEEAGILAPLSEKRWGRAWECRELFDLVEDFERGVRVK